MHIILYVNVINTHVYLYACVHIHTHIAQHINDIMLMLISS